MLEVEELRDMLSVYFRVTLLRVYGIRYKVRCNVSTQLLKHWKSCVCVVGRKPVQKKLNQHSENGT